MGIFIKLMILPVAFMAALSFAAGLIPTALMLMLFGGIVVGSFNACLAGIRHGDAGAAWQGFADGFGGTARFVIGILKTLFKLVFSIIKGLV